MTVVVSWIGVTNQNNEDKPSSLYIASDSRISWHNGRFDNGRKVFAFKNSPDVMAYCGDVMFPSIVLNQVVELADNGLLFDESMDSQAKFEKIQKVVQEQFSLYPREINIISGTLKILFASRDERYSFKSYLMSWEKGRQWELEQIDLMNDRRKLHFYGSGKDEFSNRLNDYRRETNLSAGTSRAIFQCFCDTLSNIKDKSCGGAPQLVGLYNHSNAKNFGVIYNNERYLLGAKIDKSDNLNNVEWRNSLFERCDGITLKISDGAQPQPNPIPLKLSKL
jgi:hypothetical protein